MEIQHVAAQARTPCAPGPTISHLSRWENGAPVGPFYRPLLAAVYATTPAKLGFADPLLGRLTTSAIDHEGDDEVDRRHFLQIAATTPAIIPLANIRDSFDAPLRRVLPAADVDHWTEVVHSHARAYGTVTPAHLLDALTPDLVEVSQLANRYPHQRDLQAIAARLCGLTGALRTDHAADSAAEALADLDDEHRIPLLIDQAMSFADELSHQSPTLAADYRSRITTTAT